MGTQNLQNNLSARKHNNNVTKAATKHSLIRDNSSDFMYLNKRAGRGDKKGNEIDIESNRRETEMAKE